MRISTLILKWAELLIRIVYMWSPVPTTSSISINRKPGSLDS